MHAGRGSPFRQTLVSYLRFNDAVKIKVMNINFSKNEGNRLYELLIEKTIMRPAYTDYTYNDAFSQCITRDSVRNKAFQTAITNYVRGKTVVEIGSGSMLFLTRMCVEAGADTIYAIEVRKDSYEKAKKLIENEELADRIQLIHGSSFEVDLPERVDICLSEMIGYIGGIEGVARVLNDARRRFLKSDGIIIPDRCLTLMSPVSKPSNTYQDAFLNELYTALTKVVYEEVGDEFRFPYYLISNFPPENILAPPQIFETLDFNNRSIKVATEFQKKFTYEVNTTNNFDGLLLWVNLYMCPNEMIDALTRSIWCPAYIPMNSHQLKAGDQIEVIGHSCLSHSPNPNYSFEVSIRRRGEIVYNFSKDL